MSDDINEIYTDVIIEMILKKRLSKLDFFSETHKQVFRIPAERVNAGIDGKFIS